MSESNTIKLSDIKEHISCSICGGYLIEATTVIECLHTFCKSCIVKHLSDNNTCPRCSNVIHQSHPLHYISFDRTMQDIVYKLVPNLIPDSEKNETKAPSITKDSGNRLKPIDTNGHNDFHRHDEQINIYLAPHASCNLKPLRCRYLRLSSLATVTLLKKYIALQLYGDSENYKEFDLLCNENLLGKDHNLKFVSITEWREKIPPVKITYKPRTDD